MRVRAPRIEPEEHVWIGQVPRLAHLLRTARLSLLYGPAACGKTSLLREGVMPYLGRRSGDAPAAPRPARVVVPFVERRGRSTGLLADEGVEVPIYFDAWGTEPLVALRQAIDTAAAWLSPGIGAAALPGSSKPLAQPTIPHGAHFLIVLDGFEQHLAQPAHRSDIEEFDAALVEAVSRPFQPLHFLIALREEAEQSLARYRSRIARFDDHTLRLEAMDAPIIASLLWHGSGPATVPPAASSAAVPKEPAAPQRDDPPPAAKAPSADDVSPAWLASLDSVLRNVAQASREEGDTAKATTVPELQDVLAEPAAALQRTGAPLATSAVVAASPSLPLASPQPAISALNARAQAQAEPRRRGGPTRGGWAFGAAFGLVLLLLLWPHAPPLVPGSSQVTQAPAVVAPVPAQATVATPPAAPPAVLPPVDFAFDAQSGDARIAGDLAEVVAPIAGVRLHAMPAANVGALGSAQPPALAIARYDALSSARRRATSAATLRVIAPLAVEPVGFVVRDDSPLRFIHQLKGRRIDAGPADGNRALTAASIYERMFGAKLAVNGGQDPQAAFARLRGGSSGLDAVFTVGAAPAPGSGLRLLQLDPAQPASRKALQAYLPATLEAVPTLGVMSFLVAATPQDDAARARLAAIAGALCEALPRLQRQGDPRWQQLRPGVELNAGWPALPEAQSAWRRCSRNP